VRALADATPEHWRMVEANTGLIWRHVNRLRIPEHERDDAYQDGIFGLLRAAMLFDPDRGFTFATYADAWIVNGIQRGHGRAMGRNYRRATERPVDGEQWTPERSLDEPVSLSGHNQPQTLADFIAADGDTEAQGVLAATVHDATAAIVGECRDVVDLELVALMLEGEVRGGSDIAERHGIHPSTIAARRLRLRRIARQRYDEAA
jgi:RNA polymerase sigma-32 factor